MENLLRTPVNLIEAVSEWSGRLVAWLTGVLVLLMSYDVLMRYAFNHTSIWIVELEWHLFALIFLVGAAYTLKQDQHVRVDVFYTKFSPRRQAWVTLLGTLFFLVPFAIMIISTSFSYTMNAYRIGESSPDPGGLPARYLIKGAITLGFVLLLVQAVGEILKALVILSGKDHSPSKTTTT